MFFTLEQSPGEEKVKLTYWQKESPHDEEGASAWVMSAKPEHRASHFGPRRAFYRPPRVPAPVDSWNSHHRSPGSPTPAGSASRVGDAGFSVHPKEPTVRGLEGPASRAEVTQPAGQGPVAGRSTWRSQPGSWLGVVGARPARGRLKSASASGRKMSLSVSVSSGPSTHWSRGFR